MDINSRTALSFAREAANSVEISTMLIKYGGVDYNDDLGL